MYFIGGSSLVWVAPTPMTTIDALADRHRIGILTNPATRVRMAE
jgi:hypothetical protein